MTKIFSGEKFYSRILTLMKKEGLHTDSDFEDEIGMRGALYRWKTGKDEPMAESLIKIKNRFQVSLDWLLTGEEFSEAFVRDFPQSYEPGIPASVDLDKISSLVKDCDGYLRKHRLQISPERKGNWIANLYLEWVTDNVKPDEYVMKRLLLKEP